MILPPVSCFCPWSARGRHMMGYDEDRPANLCRAGNLAVPRRRLRSDLIHRPGDGTSLQAEVSCAARISCCLLRYAAAALLATNEVPSTSILCRTTASLRAKATLAFRIPLRAARRAAQLFSSEPFTGRVRITLAAS